MFNVVFPESLSAECARKIASSLPKSPSARAAIPKNVERVRLEDFDGKGTWKGGLEDDDGDDDEEEESHNHHGRFRRGPGGGQGSECVQQ